MASKVTEASIHTFEKKNHFNMFKHTLKPCLKTLFWKEVSLISVNHLPESSFMFLHLIIHKPHDLVSAINGLIPQRLKHNKVWPQSHVGWHICMDRGSRGGRGCWCKTLNIWKQSGVFIFRFDLPRSTGLEQVFGLWVFCMVIIYLVISLSNLMCQIGDL